MTIDSDPILITGCARSGTSMVAGAIHICGAWKGRTAGPTRYNRKGMVELRTITNELVKPFLRDHGWDPMGQKPLPDIERVKVLVGQVSPWKKRVHKLIMAEGQHECDMCGRTHNGYDKGPWMFKGAKVCLLWPVWDAAFPETKWIVVRRNAEDIVRSCLRTGFMRAHQTRSGWLSWVAEHERRFEEMVDAGLDIQEIWPQRMVNGDFSEIQIIVNHLGLEWKPDEVREWVDPNIWSKGKANEGSDL